MNQKTILFVIHSLGYGGAEKNLTFVANGLVQRGYGVYVYTYEGATQHYALHTDIIHITEAHIPKTKGLRRLVQIFQIRKTIRKVKPDVVISFLNYPNLLSILATLCSKTPIIIAERGDPYQGKGVFDALRHLMYRFADGAVFQTEGAKDYFSGTLRRESCVIPNPVTVRNGLVSGITRNNEIAYVARFELVQKRQDIMLWALRKVVDDYPAIRLVFYGDGPDEYKVRELVEQLNLSDYVRFAGLESNICDKIRTSRMFVLTSDYEGIPNALIEAMAVGLPVIATDCSPGGARMLIEDKVNGLLVPKGDVVAIAEAIKFLLQNEQVAESYGEKASEIVNKFTPEKIYDSWIKYINRVVG